MNLAKSYEYFNPNIDTSYCHIVGCGSVGSTVAVLLARCGVKNIALYDFDVVEEKNIVNQMFRHKDVGKPKVDALKEILAEINPEIEDTIRLNPKGWTGKMMSGFIFLCVDNIDTRRKIVEQHFDSNAVKAVFDFRTLLESAQHFAADWKNKKEKESLLNSMQFSHEEASNETPVSACGETLGVAMTVWSICSLGVGNYVNFCKGKAMKRLAVINAFDMTLDAF